MNIVKKEQELKVSNIVICVFGSPGAGKTSLASTASNPLLIDFDKGGYRSEFRPDSVQISGWKDIANIAKEELDKYNTIVIDTVGRALDWLTVDITTENAKLSQRGGALSLQGYGVLKSTFKTWLDRMISYGKDVVLLAHDKEDKKKDDIIQRPDISGSSLGEVIRTADITGYLTIENGKRILDFNPTEYHIGKDAGRLGMLTVPNFHQKADFLAELIQKTKDNLNSVSQKGQEVAVSVAGYRERIEGIATADEMNAFITDIKQGKECEAVLAQVRGLVAKRAKEMGIEHKGKGQKYVPITSAPAEAEAKPQLSIAQESLTHLPQELLAQAIKRDGIAKPLHSFTNDECLRINKLAGVIADETTSENLF